MNKCQFVFLLLMFSSFTFAQDSSKISFIIDKAQTSWLFGNSKISNLNKREFNQLEKLIQAKIDERNKIVNKKNSINSDEYFRQYIVVENEKGEKEVWVNFLCEIDQKDKWKTDVIMVSDGGKCYFNIAINLTKKQVKNFIVNGHA